MDFYPNEEGNGLDVNFTVDMPPLAASELSSRGTAGNAIKEFNEETLHIYVYNADGTKLLYHCGKEGLTDYLYDKKGNTTTPKYPYNKENKYETTAGEKETPRATFKFLASPFQAGETYQVYVTANVTLDPKDFQTAEDLKNYTVDWDDKDTKANSEMLGMFALSSEKIDGEAVSFSSASTYNLHAWLVRCASKVTVSFNTTELNDNTWIYLHNVSIHNIPMHCHLGEGNRAKVDYGTIDKGESIVYAKGYDYANAASEFMNWPVLTRGTGKYGSDHSEKAEALFFYENLQGEGKDKSQIDSDKNDTPEGEVSWPDGVNPGEPGYMDNMKYGTYIEVEAYYRSTAKGNEGRGTIKYRFMLGMDTYKDYNCYRNHHFKLTLNFRGNANDVDWHIDYDSSSDNPIYVPQPFYISYLYGENVEIPITVDGKLTKGTKVITEIVENNWKPMDASSDVYWTGPVWASTSSTAAAYDGPWNGFLTLWPTNSNSNLIEDAGSDYAVSNSDAIGRERTVEHINDREKAYLMSYWYGGLENMTNVPNANINNFYTKAEIQQNENMYVPKQGYREYSTDTRNGRVFVNDVRDNADSYEIIESTNGANNKTKTHLYLPLYTRALFMVKQTGFSGANPYFEHQRKAVVKITCWVDEEDEYGNVKSVKYSKLCDVIQVRRINNPCGIYRAAGDNTSFTVNLCFRTSEKATSFMPFASEGKWSAEIESGDPGFITLNGMQRVQGRTGEYIKFQVHFVPASSGMKDKNRYAVILVKYHDYTCKHRIMVRQGYAPDKVHDSGVKWHAFNLRGGEKEADSPIEAGSQFRFGNIDYGIRALRASTEQFGVNPNGRKFTVCGRDGNEAGSAEWWVNNKSLKGYGSGEPNLGFQTCQNYNADTLVFRQHFELKDAEGKAIKGGGRPRLPKFSEWKSLRDDPELVYTFGICYDGNSTGTSMTADNAFNYLSLAFGGVMTDGAVFKVDVNVDSFAVSGVVNVEMDYDEATQKSSFVGLSAKLGDVLLWSDGDMLYINADSCKYKINIGSLLSSDGKTSEESGGLNLTDLLNQMSDGEFVLNE
ncbi:MAG: hypothetical protein NC548_47010, partial [Lachnospiraceae bacterium]|nr:hypothetical protein [Lachnospiraceae bacterium]